MTDDERINLFIRLDQRRKKAEKFIKACGERMEELKGPILEYFIQTGTKHLNRQGVTLMTRRSIFASAMDKNQDRLKAALRAEGMGEFIREQVVSSSYSSWVREQEQDDNGVPILPDSLQVATKISEKIDLVCRKGE